MKQSIPTDAGTIIKQLLGTVHEHMENPQRKLENVLGKFWLGVFGCTTLPPILLITSCCIRLTDLFVDETGSG